MGRDSRSWSVSVDWSVSRHNSVDDRIDDALEEKLTGKLNRLLEEINEITEHEDFKRLGVTVVSGCSD